MQSPRKPQCEDDDGFPFEMHLPGYRFCGPGTQYLKHVEHRIGPKNALDAACMKHDAVYTYECKDSGALLNADKRLLRAASKRIISADATFEERASAAFITKMLSIKIACLKIDSTIAWLFDFNKSI